MSSRKPKLFKVGISMGDCNGVGPEIILKTYKDPRMFEFTTPIIYGSSDVLNFYKKEEDFKDDIFNIISSADECKPRKLNIVNAAKAPTVSPGKPDKEAGSLAFESLKKMTEDLASNKLDVIVTAPIDKDTIQSEEFKFPGHTEYLAKMSNVDEYLMLLMTDYLKVGVVTSHISIKEVPGAITKQAIISKTKLLLESLRKDFGIERPKIAVMGLNPHAGDNGLLGSEEKEIITPAIRELKAEDELVFGPYSADGFFGSDTFKKFDGIMAMYHDQGLIPFKALAFNEGVNYTAGLPIIRTSPDHGTAYGIAGQDKADETSMRTAIFQACQIFKSRSRIKEMNANPLAVASKK